MDLFKIPSLRIDVNSSFCPIFARKNLSLTNISDRNTIQILRGSTGFRNHSGAHSQELICKAHPELHGFSANTRNADGYKAIKREEGGLSFRT